MAFTTIDPSIIAVGQPTKKELFDIIKNNEDDLDSRLAILESTFKKVPVFKFYMLNGSSFNTATGIAYYKVEESFSLSKASIQIFEKGSLTGNIEIDVKKSTTNLDNASFSSVFSIKPKIILSTVGDYAESENQVFNTNASVVPGNYLRLDITTATSSGVLPRLLVTVYGE